MRIKAVLFYGLMLLTTFVFAAQLQGITVNQQAGKIKLNFMVQGAFTHKSFILPNPNRLVVDLHHVKLGHTLNSLALTNAMIRHVRSGNPNPNTLRLVFDLNYLVKIHAQSNKQGLHIDLADASIKNHTMPKLTTKSPKITSKLPNNKPKSLSNTPTVIGNSPSQHLRDVVVVIDAGHGGKDPGAKGPRNSLEKNVVLSIALKLKQLIDKQPGMRAVMTRKGDYYIGLRQRLDIARKYNGDIFVSIHADAFINQHSNGASVFALSQRGATSEAARWIAEKENYSELGGVNLSDLDDQNGIVRSVLIDLSQTATIGSSLQMGGRVLKQLGKMTNLHNHRVEQARFMVLKSPDTPSILVETGFISNPREEGNLTSNNYQMRLSQSIFQGIKSYFWDYPPHGTRVEAMAAMNRHVVKAGETLPIIAARYHISVAALEAMNPASAKKLLKVGQKLIVPSPWA